MLLFSEKTQSKKPILPARLTRILYWLPLPIQINTVMNLNVEPKDIIDAYSTPIVQQTSFWSKVKEKLGMD